VPLTSYDNLSVEDFTELALDRPLWRLLTARGATYRNGTSQTMMMMMMMMTNRADAALNKQQKLSLKFNRCIVNIRVKFIK